MLLTEFKRTRDERIETLSSSALPKGFMYYAGGHPHLVDSNNYSSGIIAYPGPIFPNNYEELEELKNGGFYIVEEEDGKINNVEWESLAIKNVKILDINCNNISAEQLNDIMLEKIRGLQLLDTILLLRVKGKLSSKATEIDWVQIYKTAQSRGCYSIARNISKMSAEGREEIELDYSSRENLESEMISEFESKTQIPKVLGHNAIRKLLLAFSEEKKEGETNADFQSRLKESFDRQFNINNSNDADTETSSNNEDNKNINTLESTN
jgi:DNA repair exonuclease SbcCD nuclease subunit